MIDTIGTNNCNEGRIASCSLDETGKQLLDNKCIYLRDKTITFSLLSRVPRIAI